MYKKLFLILASLMFASIAKPARIDQNMQALNDHLIHGGTNAKKLFQTITYINDHADILTEKQLIDFYQASSLILMNQKPLQSKSMAQKGQLLASINSWKTKALIFKTLIINLDMSLNIPVTLHEVMAIKNELLLMADSYEKSLIALYLARTYRSFDNFYEQLFCLNIGLEILKQIKPRTTGIKKLEAEFNNEFGNFYMVIEDSQQTALYFNRALELFKSINNKSRTGMLFFNLGLFYQLQKDYLQAADYFLEVIVIKEELQEPYGMGLGHMNLANTLHLLGRHHAALSHIEVAIPLLEKVKSNRRLAFAYLYHAKIQASLNAQKIACKSIKKSLELIDKSKGTSSKIKVYQEVFGLLNKIEEDEIKTVFLRHFFAIKSSLIDLDRTNIMERVLADSKLANTIAKNEYLTRLTNVNEQNIELQAQSNQIQRYWILGLFILTIVLLFSIFRQLKVNKENKQLAYMDSLTGVMNRRAYFETLKKVHTAANIEDSFPFLLMLDIDYFKSINDKYGHSTGDRVLADLGELLNKMTNQDDKVARIGGEEFAIIHYAKNPLQAIDFCHQVVNTVSSRKWIYGGNEISVTVSLGLTAILTDVLLQDIINEADKYMYKAKSRGRNRMATCPNLIELKLCTRKQLN